MKIDNMIIGAGAAGMFASHSCPGAHVLEKSRKPLAKVRVSGGGRCNVTHACFDPQLLVEHYPRGKRELLGPFHRFGPSETIAWFAQKGVTLKTEKDGRMFPTTNSSQTIIDALMHERVQLGCSITGVTPGFQITLASGEMLEAKHLLLATGSHPSGHALAQSLGHTIIPPVPSLFTFNVPSSPLLELSGIAVQDASIQLVGRKHFERGPLLLTHWGFSGPAPLKLSAWEARYLHSVDYKAACMINWVPSLSVDQIYSQLGILSKPHFGIPKNLWRRLALGNRREVAAKLHADRYQIEGKTTHKEEFVTCGGVSLKEIDFRTMESRLCPGLFFAGEILDIDGVTGGFNFQNAWTTGWLAGQTMNFLSN